MGRMFQFCFPPESVGKKGERATLLCQTISAPRDGQHSFDDILETSIWGRMFRRCCLSGFDGSKELLFSLLQG